MFPTNTCFRGAGSGLSYLVAVSFCRTSLGLGPDTTHAAGFCACTGDLFSYLLIFEFSALARAKGGYRILRV